MHTTSEFTAGLLRDNWLRVTAQIAQSCQTAGREPQSVRIVAASKYVEAELAWQLAEAGCLLFGENRPQALWDKVSYFEERSRLSSGDKSSGDKPPAVEWHLIGHLQRNKIQRSLPMLTLLHSLDSYRLAQAVSQAALAMERRMPVLLELNVTADATKTGMSPSQVEELLANIDGLPGLDVRGLMAMSSLEADALRARREFEQVRAWRDQWQSALGTKIQLNELSMGMSGDFDAAIAAGSTLVRIGSSLWQGL